MRRQARSHVTTLFSLLVLVPSLLALAGCAAEEATHEEASAPSEEATQSRVFFVEPEDHSTIGELTTFRFGAENFTIEPVGDGVVNEGAGHFHIGLDTDCLEPGVVIPTADPWIHFGDGSAEIEMQLAPGEHKLCLQIGDGEHRTLEGLDAVIMVHVAEEDEESAGGDT